MTSPVSLQALRDAVGDLPAALSGQTSGRQWVTDPCGWVRVRARRFAWSKQREGMEAVRDHRRVAIRSCHSTGKTAVAAMIAAWWIDAHPPGTAFVVTSAPTGPQVKALLWREINRLHRLAGLPGRTNLTEWYIGDELVGLGRKSSDYNEHAFQGIHALHVLVILDEASGINETLWVAVETIASNQNARILAIGNPDDNDSQFAKICAPESGWHVISIGYADTPNFTDEEVPDELRALLISAQWVEDRRREWGEDSALFSSKCLGEFPPRGLDAWAAIQYGAVSRCRVLELPPQDDDVHEAGIDVGAGGDRTVIYERVGPRAGRCETFRDPDPMATVARLALSLHDWDTKRAKVDVGGLGWGIYGRLRELSSAHNPRGECTHSAEVIGVNFGAGSAVPKRFLNKRAELWWAGRERSRLEQWDLGAVSDEVVAELTAPRYVILDSGGKVKIEPKDEVIKRMGRSPDLADALLLAFHDGPSAATQDTFHQPVEVGSVGVFAAATIKKGATGGASPFGGGFTGGGLGIAGPR